MKSINLILATLWLVVGVGFLSGNIGPEKNQSTIIGIGCIILSFYNLVRWWSLGSKPPVETWQPRRRRGHEHPEETPNPELDFSKKEEDKKT